jgi:site-specific recombinase XerD
LKFGGSAEFGAFDPMTAERIQAYLGHSNIQHTVRYTELSPTQFKDFWRQ